VAKTKVNKVKTILISQPKPTNFEKSPYATLAKKYKVKIDFRQFIQVEGIPFKEFRKEKVILKDYSAIIFTSLNAIDHFFRICTESKTEMSAETKYICRTESIALYLQRYIHYRKRKVFYGKGTYKHLEDVLKRFKDSEKFLYPRSNITTRDLPQYLKDNEFEFSEAHIYNTVSSDLSDLEDIFYDMIVFYSPLGVKSLYENFPEFKQNETRLAGFGPSTIKSLEDHKLEVNIKAPSKETPSMTMAIEKYIKDVN